MKKLGLLVALVLSVGGCANDDESAAPAALSPASLDDVVELNRANDAHMHLVARVRLGDDHAVEFYEPSSGVLVQSETARVPAVPVVRGELAELTPTELHARLAPGQPVPFELVAAEQRWYERSVLGPVDAAAAETPPRVVAKARPPASEENGGTGDQSTITPQLEGGSCSSEWYLANLGDGCRPGGPVGGEFSWCMLDWWDGRHTWTRDAQDGGRSHVCADIGGVVFEMRAETGYGVWTVPQGWWRYATTGSRSCFPWLTSCNQDMEFNVLNAIGSRFQTSGWFWDI